MASFTDATGRTLSFDHPPKRIVSLVPSQTELLYHLGLETEVVGITKFCIHPDHWFRGKTRIGGTKQIHPHRIDALQPDLIIANKEENVQEQVEALLQQYPVWVTDVNTYEDALQMITEIGQIVDREAAAADLVQKIKKAFSELALPPRPVRAAYFIWKDPWMGVGNDTFIHHMMEKAGFHNVLSGRTRYPEIDLDELTHLQPDVILLSSEPYPFSEKHKEELGHLFQNVPVLLVDGECFSWYGSRLLHTPVYFRQLQSELQALSLF